MSPNSFRRYHAEAEAVELHISENLARAKQITQQAIADDLEATGWTREEFDAFARTHSTIEAFAELERRKTQPAAPEISPMSAAEWLAVTRGGK